MENGATWTQETRAQWSVVSATAGHRTADIVPTSAANQLIGEVVQSRRRPLDTIKNLC